MKNTMEETIDTSYIDTFRKLYYHSFEIRFIPVSDINLIYWPGSVIRNNLLYASRQVQVEDGTTLYDLINELPINKNHCLYQELSGGFPKGYALGDVLIDDFFTIPVTLRKDDIYTFSISLVGQMANYYTYFIEAVRLMCFRGIGSPMTSLRLLDVSEVHPRHLPNVLYVGGSGEISPLRLPVTPADFIRKNTGRRVEIKVDCITPVNLVQNRKKKNQEISFQDKQNGFPSFYQFTRSVMYRLDKLASLYSDAAEPSSAALNQEMLDKWIMQAAAPVLSSVNLRRLQMPGPPKKEGGSQMNLCGYIGDMTYHGFYRDYMDLLLFAQGLGVGNDVTYGLGQYKIHIEIK